MKGRGRLIERLVVMEAVALEWMAPQTAEDLRPEQTARTAVLCNQRILIL